MIRISDLRNFVETAPQKTMAAACRDLGITQPALSESIKRLESDIQQVLFYRSKTGIRLTSSGQWFLIKARAVLDNLEELNSPELYKYKSLGRSISIGCHPNVASYVLPKALVQFGQMFPDYKAKIIQGSSRQIQTDIQSGQVDVGLIVNPQSVPDLVIKNIAQDEIFVWSNGHKAVHNKVICHSTIFQTQNILRKWKHSGLEIIDTDNFDLIGRMTLEGVGYGIMPERVVKLLDLNLHKHSELPTYKDSIALVHRPEFGKNQYEKSIIESIKATFK